MAKEGWAEVEVSAQTLHRGWLAGLFECDEGGDWYATDKGNAAIADFIRRRDAADRIVAVPSGQAAPSIPKPPPGEFEPGELYERFRSLREPEPEAGNGRSAKHRVRLEFDDSLSPRVVVVCPPEGCEPGGPDGCDLAEWVNDLGPELLRGAVEVEVEVEWPWPEDAPIVYLRDGGGPEAMIRRQALHSLADIFHYDHAGPIATCPMPECRRAQHVLAGGSDRG